MFTVVAMPALELPSKSFFATLAQNVAEAIKAPALTNAQGLALCEYLDCLSAKASGLQRTHASAAAQRLQEFMKNELSEADRACLAKRSPAARRFYKVLSFAPAACSETVREYA